MNTTEIIEKVKSTKRWEKRESWNSSWVMQACSDRSGRSLITRRDATDAIQRMAKSGDLVKESEGVYLPKNARGSLIAGKWGRKKSNEFCTGEPEYAR